MTAFGLLPRLLPDGAFSCPYPSWLSSESICSRSLRSNSIACCLSWATCSSAVIFDPFCCVAGKGGLFSDKLDAILLFDSVVVQAAYRRNLETFGIFKSCPVHIRVRFSAIRLRGRNLHQQQTRISSPRTHRHRRTETRTPLVVSWLMGCVPIDLCMTNVAVSGIFVDGAIKTDRVVAQITNVEVSIRCSLNDDHERLVWTF